MIALACALLSPASAADLTTFNAHGFNVGALDGDPRDGLEGPRAGRFEAGKWWAGGLFEYARSPLVLVQPSGAIERDLDGIVALNTTFGVSVHSNVRLEGSLPLYFASTSVDGGQGVGLGDARIGALVEMIRPDQDDLGFGLGISPYLSLPTGTSDFLADKSIGGGGSLAAGYAAAQVTVSGDVGVEFRHGLDLYNLNGSDRLVYGLQIGYLVQPDLGFTAEVRLHSPFSASDVKGAQFPAEIHLSGRKQLASGGFFVGGVSLPASSGAGTAIFRAFVGAGFGKPTHNVIDTDGDGFFDDVDACITDKETVNAWKDDDGCPDGLADVSIVTKFGETVVTDATITVTPPPGVAAPASLSLFQAMPQTEWAAAATEGGCLVGTGKVTTVEPGQTTTAPSVGVAASGDEVAGDEEADYLTALRHEFRTPLNAVLGFSDVLLSGIDGEVNESQREDLEDYPCLRDSLEIAEWTARSISPSLQTTISCSTQTASTFESSWLALRPRQDSFGQTSEAPGASCPKRRASPRRTRAASADAFWCSPTSLRRTIGIPTSS